MDAFTLVDAGVAVIIIVSGILAYSRGFVRETLAIVGWIVAAILAFMLAPAAQPLISEIPYLGNFLGDSCELTVIAAFAAVFALSLVLTSLFTPLFSSFIATLPLVASIRAWAFSLGCCAASFWWPWRCWSLTARYRPDRSRWWKTRALLRCSASCLAI